MDNNLNNNKAQHIILNIIILMSNLLFLVNTNTNNNDKRLFIILHRTSNNLDGRGMGSRDITTLMALMATERHSVAVARRSLDWKIRSAVDGKPRESDRACHNS